MRGIGNGESSKANPTTDLRLLRFPISHSRFPPMREILVADDHPLFRDALKRAILTAWPNALMHEADSVESLQALVDAHADAE